MRIHIRAAPLGALSVLETLPASRLSVLEGFNGIGKTLAVRLLEVCTGTMPYRLEPNSWRSLCQGLGPFQVSVSGLLGDDIHWVGDSRSWPLDSSEEPRSEWFTEISIGGRAAGLDDVRRNFTVHRVAGDEGLVETLARATELFADSVRRWARRVVLEAEAPLPTLEASLGAALDQLGATTEERFAELRRNLEDRRVRLSRTREELDTLFQSRRELEAAAQAAERLASLARRLPALEKEAGRLDAEIAELQADKRRLDDRLTRAIASTAVDEPKRRELTNARITLERNDRKLSEALKKAASLASRIGVPAKRIEVQAALASSEEHKGLLRRRQIEMDAAPTMRRVLSDISGSLDEAEEQGLTDQVAFDDPETQGTLSVSQMRSGVVNRRVQLEGEPPSPEMAELARQIAEAASHHGELSALLGQLDEVERFRRLTKQSEARVEAALAGLSNVSSSDLREIEAESRKAEERLMQLAASRASLREQMGGSEVPGLATLEAQVEAYERNLGVERGEFRSALDAVVAAIEDTENRATSTRASLAETQRAVANAEADIGRAWSFLVKEDQSRWIRDLIPIGEPAGVSPDIRLTVLSEARGLIERALERLGRHRIQIQAVERALGGIGQDLRRQPIGAVEYVDELQHWLGSRFHAWFNQPILRRELFPAAEGPISVDVKAKEVSWTEEHDAVRSRPLEAFSSGEQAFAYTRARLAILDEDPSATNRLIALDEFGAFIAHDRLNQLLKYLKERALARPHDQVVVILPLRQDYEQESQSALGGDSDRFEELAEQVRKKRYAVRTLL